jgi:outer membrane receptor protein involved in Fe transport
MYELYYNDDGFTQVANPDLEPESIYSTELEHSHRFSTTVSGTASVYANYSTDLIVAQGSGDEADPLRYENSGSPLLNVGAEVELRRDFRQGWMIAASYSLQHGRYLAGAGVSDLISARRSAEHRNVANSPEHLAALKGAVPIVARHVTLASRLSFEGPRFDRFESATGERQGRSDAVAVWDFVFSGTEKRWGLDWAVGVYNAFDWRYSSPVSAEFRQRSIAQSGRTLLASAKIRF